ncbi:MAG: hypothetical protein K0Q55_2801 [Verrucomicrobia bacterium]|jgi:hypothetical protein|nr:hypothetical protein [Verrucomicrobiota bacterium]
MRVAFKEWAIVVDALAQGEQIIILRKGGISEGKGGFQVEHPQFLFWPTLFHQQREQVVARAQQRFDAIAPELPPAEVVRLEYYAEVVHWERLESLEAAQRLKGQHIWREEVITDRFDWGKQKAIFALAVRVHRLPKRIELPVRPEYGGCKSWVELTEEISATDSQPVLSQEAFELKLKQFKQALDPVSV